MKNIILFVVIAAVLVGGIVYFRNRGGYAPTDASPSVSMSTTPVPTAVPTATPSHSALPSGSNTPPATPTPGVIFQQTVIHDVNIQGFAFSPATLTVKKGDVVVFKNLDSVTHTVTALNKFFDSNNLRQNDQWTLETANLAPGTYIYQCTIHTSMRGTIVVQ